MSNIFADLIEAHGLGSVDVTESKVEETKEGTQVDEEVKDGAKVGKGEEPKEEPVAETDPVSEDPKENNEGEDDAKQPESEDNKKDGEEGEDKKKEDEPKAEDDKKDEGVKEEDKALEEAKKEIAELKAKVETLTAENTKLSKQVETEKALKESAEAELISFRTERKKSLIENVNNLRTQLNLPAEKAEHLMESSEEALNLTIKSLTEFVQVQRKTLAGLSVIESPVAVSEEKDNTNKEKVKVEDVKESFDDSNNELEQNLLNIMQRIF